MGLGYYWCWRCIRKMLKPERTKDVARCSCKNSLVYVEYGSPMDELVKEYEKLKAKTETLEKKNYELEGNKERLTQRIALIFHWLREYDENPKKKPFIGALGECVEDFMAQIDGFERKPLGGVWHQLVFIEIARELDNDDPERLFAPFAQPRIRSIEEGYALLKRELDRLWHNVCHVCQPRDQIRKDALNLAAMAIRFIVAMDDQRRTDKAIDRVAGRLTGLVQGFAEAQGEEAQGDEKSAAMTPEQTSTLEGE